MNRLPLVVPCLVLTLTGAAQSVSLSTVTPVAVMSSALGTPPPSFVGVPANTPVSVLDLQTAGTILDGAHLRAVCVAGGRVRIETQVLLGSASGPIQVGTSPSPSAAGATLGPVEFLARFQAPPRSIGFLTSRAFETGAPNSAIVNQATIDVGADGTIEVTSSSVLQDVQVPVTFGASGQVLVKLTIENQGTATGPAFSGSTTEVTLMLPPATCTITPYGFGCLGASSNGAEVSAGATRAITLLGAGAFVSSPVISAFGAQNTGPMLPGGCTLLTDATIAVPLLADPFGAVVHSFTIASTAVGTLYHQFVPIDLATFSFRASNGLEIACVP